MYHKFLLTFSSLILGIAFVNNSVFACSCGPPPTVQDAFDRSQIVLIAKAVSLGTISEKARPDTASDTFKTIKMVIEKVYKGNLKADEELTFYAGDGGCSFGFTKEDIGKQFLFYLSSNVLKPKLWYVGMCGRNNWLGYANDDLLYLDNLAKVRGKSRIYGTVAFEKDTNISVEGIKIQVISAKKTYTLKTDKNGVYEIYDSPAGKYWIKPEIPNGWKVDKYSFDYSEGYAGEQDAEYDKQRGIPIILHPKKHAEMNIDFEIENAFRGKVIDPNGKPMKDICLHAVPFDSKDLSEGELDCTNAEGNFSIDELSPGSYVLVANWKGKISSDEPFKTLFYPGVSERELAVPLKIALGEFRENIIFQIPKLEEVIVVEGVFLYSDDQPVANESVEFTASTENKKIDGKSTVRTDSQGRFSLKVLKGLQGQLFGSMYVHSSRFENCSEVEKLIRDSGKDSLEAKTQIIELNAENNLAGVILRFPFPGCKKATK